MKKTKKLLALVMAMVMAFSLMAVTAAAYGAEEHEHTHVCSEETIQPRKPAKMCSYCGQGMAEYRSDSDYLGRFIEFRCENSSCSNYLKIVKIYW